MPAAAAADKEHDTVERLLREMTLHEKISQLSSNAPAVERLGIGAFNFWAGGCLLFCSQRCPDSPEMHQHPVR